MSLRERLALGAPKMAAWMDAVESEDTTVAVRIATGFDERQTVELVRVVATLESAVATTPRLRSLYVRALLDLPALTTKALHHVVFLLRTTDDGWEHSLEAILSHPRCDESTAFTLVSWLGPDRDGVATRLASAGWLAPVVYQLSGTDALLGDSVYGTLLDQLTAALAGESHEVRVSAALLGLTWEASAAELVETARSLHA